MLNSQRFFDITSKKYYEAVALLLVGMLVVSISFYCFRTLPVSWFDEGILFQVVKNIAHEGVAGVQLAPSTHSDISLISAGFPVLYPAAAAIRVFGTDIGVLRVVAIFFLLGFVFFFYLLARQLYGPRLALLSSALLATFSPLYGNGKVFLGEVPGLFYFAAGLFFLARAEGIEKKTKTSFFVAGLLLGLAAGAKPTYLLILPALAAGVLLRRRAYFGRSGRKFLYALALGILIALALWAATQFGGGTSLARVYSHYSNPYYIENFITLAVSNIERFFTEPTPIHFLVLLLFASWFFIKRYRAREVVLASEITALFFAILLGTYYLRTVGWYRYFFPAHAMLFLFFAPGLESVVENIIFVPERMRRSIFIFLVAVAIGIQWMPLRQENLRSCSGDAPTELAPIINSMPAGSAVFFYNVPHIAARFEGSNYYQYIKMSDNFILGKENEDLLAKSFFPVVIVPDNNEAERGRIPPCYRLMLSEWKNLVYVRNLSLCQSDLARNL